MVEERERCIEETLEPFYRDRITGLVFVKAPYAIGNAPDYSVKIGGEFVRLSDSFVRKIIEGDFPGGGLSEAIEDLRLVLPEKLRENGIYERDFYETLLRARICDLEGYSR